MSAMRWLDNRVPPPVVGLVLGVAMGWLAAPWPHWSEQPMWRLVAVAALALTGLAFDASGLWVVTRARTTINPLHPERATHLVTDGVYRLTRNPMYVGLILLLTAWALYLGRWPLLAGPVLGVLYLTRFQIQPEERILLAHFGEPYRAYMGRVRRWL